MAGVIGDLVQFTANTVGHQLMEALTEYVSRPDLLGIVLKFIHNIAHQLLTLLLRADQRGDFRADIGTDNMDGPDQKEGRGAGA